MGWEELAAYAHSNAKGEMKTEILTEAERIINGPRRESYGDAQNSFKKIAIGWEEIIGHPVNPSQVALCMIWLKMCREINSPKKDNRVDIAGYTALLDILQSKASK